MAELKKNLPQITPLNTSVAALSADSPAQSQAFKSSMGLPFTLLCDSERRVVQQYDLLNPYEHGGIAYPAVFIIKSSGIIGYRSLDKTASRVNLSEVIAFLKAVNENPGLTQESQSPKQWIVPKGSDLKQIAKNMIKGGNRDDWKHYLGYPLMLMKMPFRKK